MDTIVSNHFQTFIHMEKKKNQLSRREALKLFGTGIIGVAMATTGISSISAREVEPKEPMVARRKQKGTSNMAPLLGFGMMRFPTLSDKSIDEELSLKMIDYAYKHGVNYFDTAFNYHGGTSEIFAGKALKRYPRASFYLATKMPGWMVTSLDKAKEIFATQLERCQVDYFDYYLLHSISREADYVRVYEEIGTLDYLIEEKKAGRIRNLGFSFHGSNELFDKMLEKYDWDFVQIQLNYHDWDQIDAKYLYKRLEEKDIPCIVMEPIRGGMLAKLNPDAEAVLKGVHPDKSIASWALRYVASLPGVLTILSGMSAMEHVVDNVHTLSTEFQPLNDEERVALDKALNIFLKTRPIRCTACKYCMPCKFGVDIPANFMHYNKCVNESNIPERDSQSPEEFERRKKIFLEGYYSIPEEARADKCRLCGKCERSCPQRLKIADEMERITKLVQSLQ